MRAARAFDRSNSRTVSGGSCSNIVRVWLSIRVRFLTACSSSSGSSSAGVTVALSGSSPRLSGKDLRRLRAVLGRRRRRIARVHGLRVLLRRHVLHRRRRRRRRAVVDPVGCHRHAGLLVGERRRQLALAGSHAAHHVRRAGNRRLRFRRTGGGRALLLCSPPLLVLLGFPLSLFLLLPGLPFLADFLELCF